MPGHRGQKSHHLLVDVLEVHQPGVPELKLDSGQGVQPIQQGLGRVFAQHIPDLVGPVNDDGLDGVQQRVVQGGGDPAEPRAGGRWGTCGDAGQRVHTLSYERITSADPTRGTGVKAKALFSTGVLYT